MYWSDIPRQPSARTLRWFALLWMLFFGSIAGWQFFLRDHETLALVWLLLALSLGPVGLVSPKLLRGEAVRYPPPPRQWRDEWRQSTRTVRTGGS